MIQIHTTGYPRSGNTWLGWLLSDLFDCAWVQMGPGDPPLYKGDVTDDRNGINIYKHHRAEKTWDGLTFFVYRDPRDVAVSVLHYAKLPDLWAALNMMRFNISVTFQAFPDTPAYRTMIEAWWNKPAADFQCSYEDLHHRPLEVLRAASQVVGRDISDGRIGKAIDRQSFARQQLSHAMRRGVVGDWRNFFTHDLAFSFNQHFGDILMAQGYVKPDDKDWWACLP